MPHRSSSKRNASEEVQVETGSSAKRTRRQDAMNEQPLASGSGASSRKGKDKDKRERKNVNGWKTRKRLDILTKRSQLSQALSPDNSSGPTLVSSDQEAAALVVPKVDKGKGKAEDEIPVDAAIARLRKELKAKDDLLTKHQDAFTSLQGSLQCQICLEVMWDPYISTCGHISCLSCLKAWFLAPHPDARPDEPPPPAPHHRRKSCPSCRATIRMRPTPVFLLKSIIGTLKPHMDHACLETAPPPGHGDSHGDVWDGIFPPLGLNGDRAAAGELPPGVVDDIDDGVLRCADCFFEIFDGRCGNCNRYFDLPGVGGLWDDGSDGSSGYGDIFAGVRRRVRRLSVGFASSEDDDEEEMVDFIVPDGPAVDGSESGSDGSNTDGSAPIHAGYRPRRGRHVIDDEDEDEDDDAHNALSDGSDPANVHDPGYHDEEAYRLEQARARERFFHGDGESPYRGDGAYDEIDEQGSYHSIDQDEEGPIGSPNFMEHALHPGAHSYYSGSEDEGAGYGYDVRDRYERGPDSDHGEDYHSGW